MKATKCTWLGAWSGDHEAVERDERNICFIPVHSRSRWVMSVVTGSRDKLAHPVQNACTGMRSKLLHNKMKQTMSTKPDEPQSRVPWSATNPQHLGQGQHESKKSVRMWDRARSALQVGLLLHAQCKTFRICKLVLRKSTTARVGTDQDAQL
eukprot:5670518-Amphidinium_carterae.1